MLNLIGDRATNRTGNQGGSSAPGQEVGGEEGLWAKIIILFREEEQLFELMSTTCRLVGIIVIEVTAQTLLLLTSSPCQSRSTSTSSKYFGSCIRLRLA
jgi:hypothetical protein